MQKQVTIYSGTGCGGCTAAKNFFKKNNIEFTEFNIQTSEPAMQFLMKKGIQSIPFIIIGDIEIIGFNEEKIIQALSA